MNYDSRCVVLVVSFFTSLQRNCCIYLRQNNVARRKKNGCKNSADKNTIITREVFPTWYVRFIAAAVSLFILAMRVTIGHVKTMW